MVSDEQHGASPGPVRDVQEDWAVRRPLAEPPVPPGARHQLWILLRLGCHEDGLELDGETRAQQFRLHLYRNIGYSFGDPRVTDIAGLASVALSEPSAT